MGRTLFWYVFRDLLKIFVMTSGTLAGIMSFGGLLRPLTQQGLDPAQIGQMLFYFTPAMLAYSLPIAALFATSVVYGRLSADNELTACRAGGIGLGPVFGMSFPALLFGILVAVISLVFLCFLVPTYTLKVERVVYSNMAKLIATKIDRTHEIRFGGVNIFAQKAYLPPPDPSDPNRQQVVLEGVSFVQYEKPDKPEAPATKPAAGTKAPPAPKIDDKNKSLRVPREFMMARSATIDIREREDDQVSLIIGLEGGIKYPREFSGGTQIGIELTQFGPLMIPSPIKEDTKFMDVGRLKLLYDKPEESRKIASYIADFLRRDQTRRFLTDLQGKLNGQRFVQFKSRDDKSTVTVSLDPAAPPAVIDPAAADEVSVPAGGPSTIMFERKEGTETRSFQWARELRIRARPDNEHSAIVVTIELYGRSPGAASTRPVSGNYSDVIEVRMPLEIQGLKHRKLNAYTHSEEIPRADRDRLRRELIVLNNNIWAEAMGRLSFSTSCLILVMVGATLGMMFRSGNFLTAFAVSFVPALLCITLIVAGQQMCHAVPFQFESKPNPLKYGIALIWTGNVVNLVIATTLLWRIQRR
ncbi:LptF/LptG family permease [Humisphaera borealis]|uniref:LptF/LptG family permease n=1 Tax=Humisphaera borealis TaxID=2807512 RepID=A0A7M2WSD1_9BACT|nr:LptF/LptG family permease [Humisphaera borealis]QOV87500.1 LptF/LptG family permease [Humisphaera borealis]